MLCLTQIPLFLRVVKKIHTNVRIETNRNNFIRIVNHFQIRLLKMRIIGVEMHNGKNEGIYKDGSFQLQKSSERNGSMTMNTHS